MLLSCFQKSTKKGQRQCFYLACKKALRRFTKERNGVGSWVKMSLKQFLIYHKKDKADQFCGFCYCTLKV